MPGICGILTTAQNESLHADLATMVGGLTQYMPCTQGTWIHQEAGLYVGWAIQRASFSDCLPAWNEKRDCVLFFFGSHYADKDEVTKLRSKQHIVRKVDASYLVHLYEEKGIAFLSGLNGVFHGMLFDLRSQTGFFFCDRFGLKRLYYHFGADSFFFSTEIAPLLQLNPTLRSIDYRCLYDLLSTGYVRDQTTLFRDVRSMPGASVWTFQNKQIVAKNLFFTPAEWENCTYLAHEYFAEKVHSAILGLLPRYLRSEDDFTFRITPDLGCRLLAQLTPLPREKVTGYSVVGDDRERQILKSSKLIAGTAVRSFEGFRIPGDFYSQLIQHCTRAIALSSNAGDTVSPLACYLVPTLRRLGCASLTSHGYNFAVTRPSIQVANTLRELRSLVDCPIGETHEAISTSTSLHPLTNSLFSVMPNSLQGVMSAYESEFPLRMPFIDLDLLQLFYRTPSDEARVHFSLEHILTRALESKTYLNSLGALGPLRRILARAKRLPLDALAFRSDRADHDFLESDPVLAYRLTPNHHAVCLEQVRAVLLDPASIQLLRLNGRAIESEIAALPKSNDGAARVLHRLFTATLYCRYYCVSTI